MVLLQRARLPPQVELEELTEEAVVVTAVMESWASVVQAASGGLQAQELVLVWTAGCRQQEEEGPQELPEAAAWGHQPTLRMMTRTEAIRAVQGEAAAARLEGEVQL